MRERRNVYSIRGTTEPLALIWGNLAYGHCRMNSMQSIIWVGAIGVGMEATFDVCPLELADNDNVVNFADVDGSAFIFAKTSLEGEPVRAELDRVYDGTGFEFMTARHSSTVDLDTYDGDYDMLFIYE